MMGKQTIKFKRKEDAQNFYLARPHTFTRGFSLWLWVLGLLGLAKKYVSRENDKQGRPLAELHGYAYKGAIYVTKEVTWEYESEQARKLRLHSKAMDKAMFGAKP